MDVLLPRDRFALVLSDALGIDPAALRSPVTLADPVVLLRIDDVVDRELGVDLPETALTPPVTLAGLYRAYAQARVTADLEARS
jgi:hypothetical protein